MSDIVDRANREADLHLQTAIEATLNKRDLSLPYRGSCYYCNESTPSPLRFCDDFCRDDYEYLESRKAANIRV